MRCSESAKSRSDLTSSTRAYRLITEEEWRDARNGAVVPYAEIDHRDGFFHLSTQSQLLETARLHFGGHTDLLALEIDLDGVSDPVRLERAEGRGDDPFPHLYGALPVAAVTRVHRLEKRANGAFEFAGDAV